MKLFESEQNRIELFINHLNNATIDISKIWDVAKKDVNKYNVLSDFTGLVNSKYRVAVNIFTLKTMILSESSYYDNDINYAVIFEVFKPNVDSDDVNLRILNNSYSIEGTLEINDENYNNIINSYNTTKDIVFSSFRDVLGKNERCEFTKLKNVLKNRDEIEKLTISKLEKYGFYNRTLNNNKITYIRTNKNHILVVKTGIDVEIDYSKELCFVYTLKN